MTHLDIQFVQLVLRENAAPVGVDEVVRERVNKVQNRVNDSKADVGQFVLLKFESGGKTVLE
jgi:hypothetical protein